MRTAALFFSGLMLASFAPAAAQSVSMTAGNLHGTANAGASGNQHASGKNRPCSGQGITVRSAGGNVSSSVSVSSSGGETVVAGGGSPGSVIKRYDCRKTRHRS
jgi:hypothetical protein